MDNEFNKEAELENSYAAIWDLFLMSNDMEEKRQLINFANEKGYSQLSDEMYNEVVRQLETI